MRLVLTGRLSGPDIPAQLAVLANAGADCACDVVPFEARLAELKALDS